MNKTKHLSPEDFVDALDGALAGAPDAHLRACSQCRDELAAIQTMASLARSLEVPEPSPLFWDHFSERVGQATAAEKTPRRWWGLGWAQLGALTAAAGVLVLAFVLAPRDGVLPADELAVGAPLVGQLPDDDGSWNLLMGLAAEVDTNDLRQAATPAAGTADSLIEELSSEQRAALARLLQKEMGDL